MSKPIATESARRSRPSWFWIAAGAVGLAAALAAVVLLRPRPRPDPDAVWRQVQADFRARRWEQADAGLKTLEALRKPTEVDRILRAQLALARDRVDPAIADLDSIPDTFPMAGQSRLVAGQAELRRGRLRPAEAYFLKAIALDPKLLQARKELVYIYGMQMRRRDLAEQFQAISKTDPLDYDQVLLWSATRGAFWNAKIHSADLDRFIKADPKDERTRLAMADLQVQIGQPQKAEEYLATIGDANPEARAIRARIAFDRGDIETARRLLAEGPTGDPALARLRGRLALTRRSPKEALAAFQAAHAAEPLNRDTLFGLGHAYRMLGDEAHASPYLTDATRLDRLADLLARAYSTEGRADLRTPFDLSAACESVGRIPEARAWLKVVISRDPFNEEAQRELFRLDSAAPKAKSPASDAPPAAS